jgi:hypothetical protein
VSDNRPPKPFLLLRANGEVVAGISSLDEHVIAKAEAEGLTILDPNDNIVYPEATA